MRWTVCSQLIASEESEYLTSQNRPEAVNISNVAALADAEGKPHFKYIVEGANLFLTQQARLFLEKRKVVLFKDSSANKGGVTSSSLEVLAGLSLSSEEYQENMIFKDGKPSPFYESYVRDIQQAITENAANEFGCIWREHARLQGAKPRTLISDELESSDFFDKLSRRRSRARLSRRSSSMRSCSAFPSRISAHCSQAGSRHTL